MSSPVSRSLQTAGLPLLVASALFSVGCRAQASAETLPAPMPSGPLAGGVPSSAVQAPPSCALPYPFPARPEIYHAGWIDLNKNGTKDLYEDPAQPVERRVEDLLRQMTLEEKSCQLATVYGYRKYLKDPLPTLKWKEEIWKDGIGNFDQHCDQEKLKETATPSQQAQVLNTTQRFFVEQTRLGIPYDETVEGIRGLSVRHCTSFPSTNALGSTWDTGKIHEMGRVLGREARAIGYTNVYSPILDVARDQRWGRWEGSLGEDPYLVARLGVAWVQGLQEYAASSAKHYVAYGECRASRQWHTRTDPAITLQTLEAVHLYPFKKAVQEAGMLGVMCAYNDVNGVPLAASYDLLTKKLRQEYGFKGYVVSDSSAVERLDFRHHVAIDNTDATRLAVEAGLNVRTDFDSPVPHITAIRQLVRDGRLAEARVDDLVRDVLRVKFLVGLFDRPYVQDPAAADQIVACQAHRDLSLQLSRECLVLLKNEGKLLPFDPKKLKRLAVVGPNADTVDNYVSWHYAPTERGTQDVSVVAGLKKQLEGSGVEVAYEKGCDPVDAGYPDTEILPEPLSDKEQAGIAKAVELAKSADACIVVLGDKTFTTSGESRSRNSLELPGRQLDLLRAVQAAGKPVVLVLIHGRPTAINWADKHIPAILSASFPGAQGGTAIAEALLGRYNPGGKLNGTWPRSVGQLPMNFPCHPGANDEPDVKSRSHQKPGPIYPFGFGLSYTSFGYSSLQVSPKFLGTAGSVKVACKVKNTGAVAGDEVVQLYLRDEVTTDVAFERNLRGFRRVSLQPGEEQTVEFTLSADDLAYANHLGQWVVEPGEFTVLVGSSSADIRLQEKFTVQPKEGAFRNVPAATAPAAAGPGGTSQMIQAKPE